jgi:hypothetical protein
LAFIIIIFHKFLSEGNPNNRKGKSSYLILRDGPCNCTEGDIYSPTVKRNGLRIQSTSVEPESDSFKTHLKNSEEGKNTAFNLLVFVWSLFWSYSLILTNFLCCCHFSQPVFKSVTFFLRIPKLGRKAVKGCTRILTSKTGVSSVKFVTPTIRPLMRLSDCNTPGLPWLPCFYGYDDGDFCE